MEAILEFGVPSELVRRMMITRLYYAAYHLALLLLRNAGLTPPTDRSVHRWALDELQQHYVQTELMTRTSLEALDELRRLRRHADYRIDLQIRERDMRRAMGLFRNFFDECCRILEVT